MTEFVKVLGETSQAKVDRKIFQKLLAAFPNEGKYLSFFAVRQRKDAKRQGKDSKVTPRDNPCMKRNLFDLDTLPQTLLGYEIKSASLIDSKTKEVIPEGTTTVYFSLNPRDENSAVNKMIQELVRRKCEGLPIGKHSNRLNYLQNYGKRGWNLVDFDAPGEVDDEKFQEEVKRFIEMMNECFDEYFTIRTKGGYHTFFHTSKMSEKAKGKNSLYPRLTKALREKKFPSIDTTNHKGGINNDPYTIVPGTIQRDHLVLFEKSMCKGLEKYDS